MSDTNLMKFFVAREGGNDVGDSLRSSNSLRTNANERFGSVSVSICGRST